VCFKDGKIDLSSEEKSVLRKLEVRKREDVTESSREQNYGEFHGFYAICEPTV
jgi:hypothetical protein